MKKTLVLLVLVGACQAIVFRCRSGVCDSDANIKISGSEVAIRLQDFDDHIEFNDSEIPIISRVVVSMPENINTFILAAVKLADLHPMALKQLHNLYMLNLSDNLLSSVDERTFSGLSNLRWLFLSHNRLRDVNAGAFSPLSDLEYLNMSHNAIEELDKRTFQHLKKLEAVYLDNNLLCSVSRGLFERNRALKFLDMSHNQLKTLHLTFHDGLFMLNLASNQLQTFKMDFKLAERENDVAILRLEGNRLRDLANVSDLRISFELNLAGNDLAFHPVDTLGGNLFEGMRELWTLNLSDTGFRFSHSRFGLENPFGQMTELKELDLSLNGLRSVDFKDLRVMELRSLHLSGNNLTELDVRNLRKLLPNLRNLEISDNRWNCSYLAVLLKQLEKIPNLEVTSRPHLAAKTGPNVAGIRCSNGTFAVSNEILLEMDHDTRIQLLENRIDELFVKLTEALEQQQNFSRVLRNLTKNFEYEVA